ncbi:MAG TPA: hypothetical protein VGI83_08880 [Gemmatimonadales bacterium]
MAHGAWGQELDRGTFTLTKGGVVIGHEAFVLKQGSTVTGGPGFSLSTTATYPTDRATITLTAQIDYGPDSLAQQLQADQTGATPRRLVVRFTPRRITVRTLSAAAETAREYPGAPNLLAVHDSLFALYLILPATTSLTLFSPTDGHRASVRGTPASPDSATVGGVRRILTHVILGQGDEIRHLWYDESGKLFAIDVPKLGVRAQR